MSRKKTYSKYLYNVGDLAAAVIDAYARKYRTEGATWSSNYSAGIARYASDERRLAAAQVKLSAWYSALREEIPAIKDAYGRAKERYKQILASMTSAAAQVPAQAQPQVAYVRAPTR